MNIFLFSVITIVDMRSRRKAACLCKHYCVAYLNENAAGLSMAHDPVFVCAGFKMTRRNFAGCILVICGLGGI